MTNNKKFENIYFPHPVNMILNVPSKYELHWHHFTEMLFYPPDRAGTDIPKICIDQQIYQMKPGDVLLIWSSEMHSVESNTENTLIGVQFPSSLLTDLPEFASYSHMFRGYHLIDHEDPQMEPLAEYMHGKLRQMLELRLAQAPFHGVEELIHLYEIFIQFALHLQNTLLPGDLTSKQGNSRTMDKINAACRYISENCDRELTLDHVADQVGFSACYFSRVFKQTTQCSFVEYLTLQRLKRAQHLLADSDAAITTIAMESGFKSISTFNRVFQKYKGCSPSEFKRHFLQ